MHRFIHIIHRYEDKYISILWIMCILMSISLIFQNKNRIMGIEM